MMKKKLQELIDEYPEILDPSKLIPTEDKKGVYIIRNDSTKSDTKRTQP